MTLGLPPIAVVSCCEIAFSEIVLPRWWKRHVEGVAVD